MIKYKSTAALCLIFAAAWAGTCSDTQKSNVLSSKTFAYSNVGLKFGMICSLNECSDSNDCYIATKIFSSTSASNFATIFEKVIGDNISWQKFYDFKCSFTENVLDSQQKYIYSSIVNLGQLTAAKVDTTNGQIADMLTLSSSDAICTDGYCRVNLSNDESTLYMSAFFSSSSNGGVCMYSFTSLSSYCMKITNLSKIQSMTIVNLGTKDNKIDGVFTTSMQSDNSNPAFNLLNIQLENIEWSKLISPARITSYAKQQNRSKLSDDGSVIYTLSSINSIGFITGFNTSTGSVVGSRYCTTLQSDSYFLLKIINSVVHISININSIGTLMQFDADLKIQSIFQFDSSTPIIPQAITLQRASNRLVIGCRYSSDLYIYEMKLEQSALKNWNTINVIDNSNWSNMITSLVSSYPVTNGVTAVNIVSTSFVVQNNPYSLNQSYNQIKTTIYTSDTSYWSSDIVLKSLSVLTHYEVYIALTCSVSGLSTVVHSFSNDLGNQVPSWIAIDDVNSKLILDTPNEAASYTFTMKSVTSEAQYSVYRNVYIRIDCLVSNCKTCSADNSKCTGCADGYQVYSNLKICASTQSSDTVNTSTKITISAVCAAIGVALLISVLTLTSPSCIWMIVGKYQALALLLLTGAYFPKPVIDFMTGFSFAMFSFGFMPVLSTPTASAAKEWLDFDLDNEYLAAMGLTSGSAFISNFGCFLTIFELGCLHLAFWVLSRCLRAKIRESPRLAKVVEWTYKFFTFSVYIRILLETSQIWLVSSINEIRLHQTFRLNRLVSFIFACLILLCSVLIILIVTCLSIKAIKLQDKYLKSKFDELFNGQKNNKLSKMHTFVRITRCFIVISALMVLDKQIIFINLSILQLFNILYLLYVIYARPMESAKDNIIKIQNEILVTMLTTVLFIISKLNYWSKLMENVWIFSITGVSLITVIILLVCLTVTICKKCRGKGVKIAQKSNDLKNENKPAQNQIESISISKSDILNIKNASKNDEPNPNKCSNRLHEEAKSPKVLSYLNEHSQIKLDIRRKYLRD